MRRKTPVEMERARIAKITRWSIRLEASLFADEKINDVLPTRIAEFERGLADGQLLTLDLPEVTTHVEG